MDRHGVPRGGLLSRPCARLIVTPTLQTLAKEWQAKVAPFSETQVAIVCRELLLGLDYLHSSGKIHRDIKAANILLSHTGKVKIADFGVAAQLTNIKSQRMTFVGTPFWMAPEVIQEEGYDFRADIWSLGITAMELIKGEPPNAELHPMKALFHIPKAPPPRLESNRFSREFKSFVAACLVKDPDERPTARDLLQHRFILRAGSVSMLRDLIESRRQIKDRREESTKPKYYEETLKDMSPSHDEDDWVFDTVRPAVNAAPPAATAKKRKLSEPPASSLEPPTDELMRINLNDKPAEPEAPKTSQPGPVGTIQRRQSEAVLTARRMSSPLKNSGSFSPRKISNPRPPSSRNKSAASQKQPLALDTSFGNSPSTTRQFRRVSHESPMLPGNALTSEPVNNENTPPPVEAVTKEARMGRQIFSKVIDPAFQELHASTAPPSKQDMLSRVGQAWSALDALDPEGEYLFFRGILERLQSDPKLSNLIRPLQMALATTPSSTPSTPQRSPSKIGPKGSPEKLIRSGAPQRSPSKRTSNVMGAPGQKPSTPQRSPSKLVMAHSNPHLQDHARRRQSGQVSLVSAAADRPQIPGRRSMANGADGAANDPAVEHTRQLADALYGRWGDGIRNRWSHT